MFQSKTRKISYDTKRKRSKDQSDRHINQLNTCNLKSGCQPILDTVGEAMITAGSVNCQNWFNIGNRDNRVFHETIIGRWYK